MPLSAGTVNNFNKDAFERLEFFDAWIRKHLALSPLVHGDETGIDIDGVKKKAAAFMDMTFRSFRYRLAKFGMDNSED